MDELQQLKHFANLFDASEDSFGEKKPKEKKRKPKTEMTAQTHFSKDGPALFMGRGKRIPITLQGYTVKMRLWKQPRNYEEQPSRRVLRLREGRVSRVTSTSAESSITSKPKGTK